MAVFKQKSAGGAAEAGGGAKVTAVLPNCGQWSYLECGHGWVPAIPVYGVELGRVVELMVQLRMSFASVHHFLEGKRGRDSKKNEPNRKKKKAKVSIGTQLGAGRGKGEDDNGFKDEGLE